MGWFYTDGGWPFKAKTDCGIFGCADWQHELRVGRAPHTAPSTPPFHSTHAPVPTPFPFLLPLHSASTEQGVSNELWLGPALSLEKEKAKCLLCLRQCRGQTEGLLTAAAGIPLGGPQGWHLWCPLNWWQINLWYSSWTMHVKCKKTTTIHHSIQCRLHLVVFCPHPLTWRIFLRHICYEGSFKIKCK